MQQLTNNKLLVDIQILDNEASAEYKRAFKTKWNDYYHLVPPNTHRSNAGKDGQKVCLERADGAFSCVAPMCVRRH